MRLPNTAHTARPWRIHAIAPDFTVEDVWALPTPGGPDDFHLLVAGIAHSDPSRGASGPSGLLWAIRRTLGRLLHFDDEDAGDGATLRDRLPADLRDGPSGPAFAGVPFAPLYETDREFAAELANRTVHGVIHLGWVEDEAGDGYHGQMAILVKRNGLLGAAYMAAITPFRHTIIYPQMIRRIERGWRER
jgi:uncharacterized protein DUF2867